ncbi:hypothetical protein QEN19_003899 [Hanseniaspora menglaensis]
MTLKSLYIHPKDYYRLESWKRLLTTENVSSSFFNNEHLDICLKTICQHYYKNHEIIDLLLKLFPSKKEYILKYIINIPCYSFSKYQKMCKNEFPNEIDKDLMKKVNKKVTDLWKYESKINKKSFGTFTVADFKLIKTPSLLIWKEYLFYILNSDEYDENYVIGLFERCLLMCSSYLSIWKMYIEYTMTKKHEKLFPLYRRMSLALNNIINRDKKIEYDYYDLLIAQCNYWYKEKTEEGLIFEKLKLYKKTIDLIKDIEIYQSNLKRLYKLYFEESFNRVKFKFRSNLKDFISYYCQLAIGNNEISNSNVVYKYLNSQNLVMVPHLEETKQFIKFLILNQKYNTRDSLASNDKSNIKVTLEKFLSNLTSKETDLLMWKLIAKNMMQQRSNIKKSDLKKQIIRNYKKTYNLKTKSHQGSKKTLNKTLKKLQTSFKKK